VAARIASFGARRRFLVTKLPCARRSRRRGRHRGHLGERHSASSVIMAVRTHHCCDPCPSARDWRQEMVAFSRSLSAVRTAECLGEDTVLMVVARQGSDVRRNRVSRVLGRACGAGGGGVVGDGGRKPRSDVIRLKSTVSLSVRFWRPQQDSNLRTRLRSAFPHTAATSRNAAWASCTGRVWDARNCRPHLRLCRHRLP
jgi:hypothetical protein